MKEIDARIKVLEEEINDIWNNGKSEDSRKGDVGEAFVGHAIKQSIFDKGYKISEKGNGTARIYKQVNSNKQGRGGIDFNVEYTDDKGNSDVILIEVKNLGDYPLSKQDYDEKVKDRFDKLDPLNNKKRILAIPEHQTKYKNIRDECPKDKITVIPIDQQLTDDTIKNGELDATFKDFKENLDKYIDEIIPDINKQKNESIEDDLKQGKEINVVGKKWEKSDGHIRNIASRLDIPDRRKRPWKVISYIRYEEI